MELRVLLGNFLFFQIGWFACLLITTPWLYPIIVALLCAHFYWIVPRHRSNKSQYQREVHTRKKELLILLKVLCIGVLIEIFYLQLGVLVRLDGSFFPPVWLLLLWGMFATTLSFSLSWLRKKLWIAAVCAAISAPLSYLAGTRLHNLMTLNVSVFFSLLVIAITWAILFPALLYWLVEDDCHCIARS